MSLAKIMKRETAMTKIVKVAVNDIKHFDRKKGRYSELYLLYDDGTWEQVWEYRWSDPAKETRLNTSKFGGMTRDEIVEKLIAERDAGKIEGVVVGN